MFIPFLCAVLFRLLSRNLFRVVLLQVQVPRDVVHRKCPRGKQVEIRSVNIWTRQRNSRLLYLHALKQSLNYMSSHSEWAWLPDKQSTLPVDDTSCSKQARAAAETLNEQLKKFK